MKSNTSNLHLLLDSIRALEKYKLFDDVYKANNIRAKTVKITLQY